MSSEHDSEGALYYIKVKGSLDPKWADWFDGFVLTVPGDGETLLNGRVPDQAALHGILNKINRLGLFLTLVAFIDNSNHCPLCGQDQEPINEKGANPSKTLWLSGATATTESKPQYCHHQVTLET